MPFFWQENMPHSNGAIKGSLTKRLFSNGGWLNQYRMSLFPRARNNGKF